MTAPLQSARRSRVIKKITKNWILYLFLIPTLIYLLVLHYWPLYGVQIAVRNYKSSKGIW